MLFEKVFRAVPWKASVVLGFLQNTCVGASLISLGATVVQVTPHIGAGWNPPPPWLKQIWFISCSFIDCLMKQSQKKPALDGELALNFSHFIPGI